jgi:hypothetical protein
LNKIGRQYRLDYTVIENLADSKFKPVGAARIHIRRDAGDFRRLSELSDSGIFYEINLSANYIITFLRSIFDVYELDGTELVLYIS